MTIFIKDRKTFATLAKTESTDWEITDDSDAIEFSTFQLAPGTLSIFDTGQWFIADGIVLVIDTITPAEERTTVRCESAWSVFNLNTFWAAPEEAADLPSSTEAFIADILAADYVGQADPAYAVPYLEVSFTPSGRFTAPDTDSKGYFTLADYIAQTGVGVSFSISGHTLMVHIAPRAATPRKLVFGDGRTIVQSRAFSSNAVAKITTIQTESQRTFYLAADGSISEAVPAERASGSWNILSVSDKDDPLAKAEAEFAKNKSAHRIEFWSAHDFAVGDLVTARLDGETFTGAISCRRRENGHPMTHYTIGDLAVTASDKLRRI